MVCIVEYFYHVILIMQIPSEELYCVGFRIQEEFETGMTRASVFQVYEFSNPGIAFLQMVVLCLAERILAT